MPEMRAYDGSWRKIKTLYAYDGSTWRDIQEGWTYDGSNWRQFFTACNASLDSATHNIGADGEDGCGIDRCERCVEWEHTNAVDADHHIRILRSTNGGTFLEFVDDISVNNSGGSGNCATGGKFDTADGDYAAGCTADGTSTQFKVRLEDDGGDTLACDDSNNEITTGTHTNCAGAS